MNGVSKTKTKHDPAPTSDQPSADSATDSESDFWSRLFKWTVIGSLLSMVLAVASANTMVDIDLFHELALYRQMESEGQMPTTDAFAYTPTNEKVVHHEWATGAIMYWVTVKFGLGSIGVMLVKYILTFGVCVGCYWYARKHGASLAVFAILAPIALEVGGWMAFNNVRAQLFTLMFLVCQLFLQDQDRQGKRWWIAAWVPLVILWGNIHGGVVSGLGILAAYAGARVVEVWLQTHSIGKTLSQVGHLFAIGVGSFFLLYVNPYGTEYVPYLIRAVTMKRPTIIEWGPIWTVKFPTLYIVSVVVAGYAIAMRGKQAIFESLALILTAYLAMKHYRHGSLYAVTWACFVPPMIQSATAGNVAEKVWHKLSLFVFFAAAAISVSAVGYAWRNEFWKLDVPTERAFPGARMAIFPVGAMDYLAEHHFTGNVIVPFESGAYVSWRSYPDVKVSIDSRYEVAYPPGAIEEQGEFYAAFPNWQDYLAKYATDAVLVPHDYPLAKAIESATSTSSPQQTPSIPWRLVYRDRGFSLYVHSQSDDTLNQLPFVDRSNETIDGQFP